MIDFYEKWRMEAGEIGEIYYINQAEYEQYVAQGGSVVGAGIMSKEDLEQRLNAHKKNKKDLRARTLNISQDCEHLKIETILSVLNNYKSIKKWAYILHDKDMDLETGEPKKPHWHIVLSFKESTSVRAVAGWFGIEMQYIQVPKGGKFAFIQCVQYLTHESEKEQKKGKHLYDKSEVKANFDFENEIIEYETNKLLKDKNNKDTWRYKVLVEGVRISDLAEEVYARDWQMLDSCRLKYIKDKVPMPEHRINIHVSGGGGVGKGLISRALARSLYPNLKNDKDIFFQVGNGANRFAGYDGQPVIIWNDFRSNVLLEAFGNDRGAVFNAFDTFPQDTQENIKYGSIKLVNKHHIVNSTEYFSDFIRGICGNEDKEQGERRFPIFLALNEEDYDLGLNSNYLNLTAREKTQYVVCKNVGANFRRIASLSKGNIELKQKLEIKALEPVNSAHNKIIEHFGKVELSEEEQRQIEIDLFKDKNLTLDFKNSVSINTYNYEQQQKQEEENSYVGWGVIDRTEAKKRMENI